MLVHIKDIVKKAEQGSYAIGAFNITNLESVLGVARAAVKANSAAIIQVSESAIKYMGLKPITHIVSTVAKNIAAQVPIALHLDHGTSFDSVFECINSGFSSVHIDASSLPLDENINLTKQVVKVAHALEDCFVAAQKGQILIDSDQADILLKGVDMLARMSKLSDQEFEKWTAEASQNSRP